MIGFPMVSKRSHRQGTLGSYVTFRWRSEGGVVVLQPPCLVWKQQQLDLCPSLGELAGLSESSLVRWSQGH